MIKLSYKYHLLLFCALCSAGFAQSSLTNLGTTSTLYIGPNFTVHCEADVNNEASATLQFDGASSSLLQLKGHFTNSTSGTLTAGVGTISFVGSAAQNADFGGDNLYDLKISNTSGDVTLTRAATVTDNLNFTSGDLITSNANILNLTAAATATGAADGNHVNGPMNKTTATTSKFTFPVGNGSKYRPCSITPASAAAHTWKGQYHNGPYADQSNDASFNHLSVVEYWTLARTSGAGDGTVTLSWDAASGVNDLSQIIVVYYNTVDWTASGANNITGTTSAGTIDSDLRSSWHGADLWTLGSSSLNNPLPVELLSFTAEKIGEQVLLKFRTAAEINSDYFEVQHSINGTTFNTFDHQSALGNSNKIHDYKNYHLSPVNGINYYQLIEHDKDGQTQNSSIVAINFNKETNTITQLYPNPSPGRTTLYFNSQSGGIYYLNIIDNSGKNIYSAMIPALIGENKFYISMDDFASGRYHIVLSDPLNKQSAISYIKEN